MYVYIYIYIYIYMYNLSLSLYIYIYTYVFGRARARDELKELAPGAGPVREARMGTLIGWSNSMYVCICVCYT